MAFAIVLFTALPAQASVSFDTDNPAVVAQPQALPDFMQNLEAIPMTDAEMAEVRGEAWYINIFTGAIIGTATMIWIYGNAYCLTCTPWYIPWFLKPISEGPNP